MTLPIRQSDERRRLRPHQTRHSAAREPAATSVSSATRAASRVTQKRRSQTSPPQTGAARSGRRAPHVILHEFPFPTRRPPAVGERANPARTRPRCSSDVVASVVVEFWADQQCRPITPHAIQVVKTTSISLWISNIH